MYGYIYIYICNCVCLFYIYVYVCVIYICIENGYPQGLPRKMEIFEQQNKPFINKLISNVPAGDASHHLHIDPAVREIAAAHILSFIT